MPIYEYRCDNCGIRKEHIQKMNAEPLTTCPVCGADSYVKLVSAAGFQLKGSGWYATDFKGSGSQPTAKPAESTPTESAPASGGCAGSCACHPA